MAERLATGVRNHFHTKLDGISTFTQGATPRRSNYRLTMIQEPDSAINGMYFVRSTAPRRHRASFGTGVNDWAADFYVELGYFRGGGDMEEGDHFSVESNAFDDGMQLADVLENPYNGTGYNSAVTGIRMIRYDGIEPLAQKETVSIYAAHFYVEWRSDVITSTESTIVDLIEAQQAIIGNQGATLPSTLAGRIILTTEELTTETSQNVIGTASLLVTNVDAASTRSYRAMQADMETLSGNTQNLTSSTALVGLRAHATHNGTGTVTGARGEWCGVVVSSTGTVTTARCSIGGVDVSGGGTITTAIAYDVAHSSTGAGAVITNSYGFRYFSVTPSGGATDTTRQAGLVCDALTGATHNSSLVIGQSTAPDGNYAIYSISTSDSVLYGKLDLSNIAAGSPALKVTATSDTPTVAFTGGGAAPTTAPAGYLEILVGASARYIPFWA